MNNSNMQHLKNFLRVARTVRDGLAAKYHDGEFSDPAGFDPKQAEDLRKANPWNF